MESLLNMLADEVFGVIWPWYTEVGDPVALLIESLTGQASFAYQRGPIIRAIDEAAATDKQFQEAWLRSWVSSTTR